MKSVRFTRKIVMGLFALSLAGGLAACDNPVEEEHEDHPVGLAILSTQGQVVASIAENQVVTGQISVAPGATQTFTVVAIGEDGDQLPLGGELGARIASQPANATLGLQGDQLSVTGTTAGSGTAEIVLVHDGHDELSGIVPVVVQ